MRQFALINAENQKYDLNSLDSFLQEPAGLGMERDIDYEQIGYEYIIIEDILKQKKPTGTICFSGYEEYLRFAGFIRSRPLTLEYTAAETYRLDVAIQQIDKTELEEGGLNCRIVMESLGTYYKMVIARNTEEHAGKIYPYSYPYIYSDFSMGAVKIDADTIMESPVEITIWGPVKNPAWAHWVNGNTVTRGRMRLELAEGRKLVISTRKIPWSIREYDLNNKMILDRYQDSDFSTERFINIQSGRNQIVFTHEGESNIKILVEAALRYETV